MYYNVHNYFVNCHYLDCIYCLVTNIINNYFKNASYLAGVIMTFGMHVYVLVLISKMTEIPIKSRLQPQQLYLEKWL